MQLPLTEVGTRAKDKDYMISLELKYLRTLLPREKEAVYPKCADKFVLWTSEAQKYCYQ